MDKAKDAQKKMEALNGKGTLEILKLNLSDLNDVKDFAAAGFAIEKLIDYL